MDLSVSTPIPINLMNNPNTTNLNKTQQKVTKQEQNIPKSFIIGGDFNAHNLAWGCEVDDRLGKDLLDAIKYCNLEYLNDRSLTLAISNKPSAVNLTICSRDIASHFRWNTLQEPYGSNHVPIIFSSQSFSAAEAASSRKHIIWNLSRANWMMYTTTLETMKIPLIYEELLTNINQAANVAIPKHSSIKEKNKGHISKPWWNNHCQLAAENRKHAFINYKQNPTLQNLMEV
ncbi:uncharacterized protein [Diabrotica undecimpunctata]|uniref:uncharacterized protein n=1 Tax=Diabrotica undecimpunctata TaxID=50387 RepID=UPI003B637816